MHGCRSIDDPQVINNLPQFYCAHYGLGTVRHIALPGASKSHDQSGRIVVPARSTNLVTQTSTVTCHTPPHRSMNAFAKKTNKQNPRSAQCRHVKTLFHDPVSQVGLCKLGLDLCSHMVALEFRVSDLKKLCS